MSSGSEPENGIGTGIYFRCQRDTHASSTTLDSRKIASIEAYAADGIPGTSDKWGLRFRVRNDDNILGDSTVPANSSDQSPLDITYSGAVKMSTSLECKLMIPSKNGRLTFSDVGGSNNAKPGIYWHSNDNYSIFRTPGDWVASTGYQQLRIRFITGIILDPKNHTYQKSHVGVNGGMAVGENYFEEKSGPNDSSDSFVAAWKNGMIIEGNVGIGMTSPPTKLTINSIHSNNTNYFKNGANDKALTLSTAESWPGASSY